MSSRTGPRATGTDGSDFSHRQRVSQSIKLSVQYKWNLKMLFGLHSLVLLAMWTKVGSEFAIRELGFKSKFFEKLDLPTAYPWEYVWCSSVVCIILGLLSFRHNKGNLLRIEYYSQFFLGILPCSVGLGSLLPELIDYIFNMESSRTPTFNGHFPMVIIWYIFFLIAFQIHIFAIYFTYHLLGSWERDVKKD
ncbi:unnamed protein product [Bursaphelenchus xylophilus]|uniref:(pine wood nematode) hypothetical protein n=1 Tax=Bursaphelenchus xylophilus TaxID=6326 RepID=A0A1I7RL07_BURXY|nr:unnamed protein product [Bursaphelenchus xylophilus]CAG9083624.1 unnamed protein product [Bursaphelenchus xylophilus]